jgi:hypothetical protein
LLDDAIDLAGRDAVDVSLLHDTDQRLLRAPAITSAAAPARSAGIEARRMPGANRHEASPSGVDVAL